MANTKAEDFVKKIIPNKKKRFILILILVVFILIFLRTCFVYVRPNEFGIKQINVGIKSGIQPEVYTTGYHFLMPLGLHIMHRFPRNIQVFELTNYPTNASTSASLVKAAHIQTSDGFFVDVDVSILYRITDPYKTITTIGPGRLYEESGIIPKAESKLKESLGVLTTEEFFNSPLRVEKAQKAKDLLNLELNPKGILIEHVLIRYFQYSDEIQRNIEAKKLKDQMVFTNQSKAKATAEEAIVKKVQQEGAAQVKIKLSEGDAYVTEKVAEQNNYRRIRRSAADKLIKLAEAEKTRLINQAYEKAGSENLVGLEMAKVYEGLEVIMLPSSGSDGMNPLDLEGSLRIFGIDR